ncbi:hypothetical protein [Desulfosoma caldarium]|uniref:hypothetical protein n=1 Tax=Desulfosoma caldarium TaxID=610254 RepID=UPI001472C926|nr:hypothetical protein [Desulfosoma caldarium]
MARQKPFHILSSDLPNFFDPLTPFADRDAPLDIPFRMNSGLNAKEVFLGLLANVMTPRNQEQKVRYGERAAFGLSVRIILG